MVIILGVLFVAAISWLEEEVTSGHFKEHAGEGPVVGGGVVFCTDDYFRRPVLTGLNFGGEVVVGPASISKIADLQFHGLIQFFTSFVRSFFLNLLLHCLGIKHLLVKNKTHFASERVFRAIICLFGSLTLFKLLSIKNKLFDGLFLLLDLVNIIFVSVRYFDTTLLIEHLCLNQLISLNVCQILISQCFRSEVGRWMEYFLRKRVSAWYLNILFKNYINFPHLIRV